MAKPADYISQILGHEAAQAQTAESQPTSCAQNGDQMLKT